MRFFRLVSRFKMYQALTMTTLLGPLTYWYSVGKVSSYVLWCACASTLWGTAVLCAMSYAFTRVVGELSYCQHNNTVQLSTLTFMGRRRDCQLPARAIVPFSDGRFALTDAIFQRLEVIEPQGVYYYSIQYGRVLDRDVMTKVLEVYV